MERGRLISLHKRISRGEVRQVIDELIRSEPCEFPEEILSDLLDIFSSHEEFYLGFDVAIALVLKTYDERIYRAVKRRSSIFQTPDTLCKLLQAGIPDSKIEQKIVDYVLGTRLEPTGMVEMSLKVLREHGSIDVLDTLLAIEFEFFSEYKIAQILKESETFWAEGVVRDHKIQIGDLLRDTIRAVRERQSQARNDWGDAGVPTVTSVDPLAGFSRHRESAEKQLRQGDPEASLNYIRKALEALLKAVIKSEGIQPRDKAPIDQLLLSQLTGVLMDKKNARCPQKYIAQYIVNLQQKSTLGSHDQPVAQGETAPNEVMVAGLLEELDKCGKYLRHYMSDINAGEIRR